MQRKWIVTAMGLSLAVGLSGCFGGSSSSSDSENGGGGDDVVTDNGDGNGAEGTTPTTGANLVYEEPRSAEIMSDDFEDRVIELQVISPDNPGEPLATVDELAVDNFDWSDRDLPGFSVPEATTLPLGVFSADLTDDGFEDAHYPFVVFNNPEGHLYRVDVRDSEGQAERISSEEDAQAVCSAEVLVDYTDVLDSVIIYEVANEDGECGDSSLKATRLGAGTDDDPQILVDDVQFSRFSGALAEQGGYAAGLHNGEGAITGYLIRDENAPLTLFRPDDASGTELKTFTGSFQSLGWIGEDNTLAVRYGDQLGVIDDDNAELVSLEEDVENDFLNSVSVGQDVYLADSEDGRILRVEDNEGSFDSEVVFNGWDADFVETLVATDDYLAWAYSQADDVKLRNLDLDTSDSAVLLDEGSYFFPLFSPGAPGDENSDGWIFYQDQEEEAAKAVEISGASSTQKIPDAEWRGSTWAPSPDGLRDEAQHVFFVEASGDEATLRARPATDAIGEHTVTFDEQPDELGFFYVGSYDAPSLLNLREGRQSGNRPDVYFVDPTDAASLERLTDSPGFDNRAVPWY